MNKRERTLKAKDIIKSIDTYLKGFDSIENVIGTGLAKVEGLFDYLESNCLVPDSFEPDEMKQEILRDYFENDSELLDITQHIEELREEVNEQIYQMSENNSRRDSWEEFYNEMEFIEDIIDINENEITSIYEIKENIGILKERIENLLCLE